MRVRIEEDRKRFARASVDVLLVPGPARAEPRCPVFGRCGGCAWQHIRYEDQLEAKRKILSDALTRIGGFPLAELPAICASPDPYQYRARTRVLVRGGLLGYRRRRSHRLCAIRSCPVLASPVDALLSRMAEAPEAWPEVEADGGGLAAPPPHLEARADELANATEEEWELCAGSQGAARSWRIPGAESTPARRAYGQDSVAGGAEKLTEEPVGGRVEGSAIGVGEEPSAVASVVTIVQGGDSLRISPGVFMQANALLWQPLVDAVVLAATEAGPCARLIELFAGAGFFTLALSRRFAQVVAVESDSRAVSDLRANLAAGERANVQVVHAPVEAALRTENALGPADCIVLDPPRSGLARDAVEGLVAQGAQRIVYLSCDPATLARDLRLLCDAAPGYRLSHVSAFDLFPQTPHVEGLAVLQQR